MSNANLMRILYMKGILNEADPVSRRPDFLPIDNMYTPDESLQWDGKVHDIDTNGIGHATTEIEQLHLHSSKT